MEATYLDGVSARAWSARLELAGQELLVLSREDSSLLARWRLDRLVAEPAGGGLTHLSERGRPGPLVSTRAPGPWLEVERNGSRARKALAALALLAVIVPSLYFATPALSAWLAAATPTRWEAKLGEKFNGVIPRTKDCDAYAPNMALRKVSQRLLKASSYTGPIEVRLIADDVVNAFALPGGLILMNRGLVQRAQTPEEVAGVLAHELGHLVHRDVLASLYRSSILTAAWSVSMGDLGGLVALDPTTLYQIATLQFSREAEEAADIYGVQLLARAGISSSGFADFFARERKKPLMLPALLSTHPDSGSRKKSAQIHGRMAKSEPELLDAPEWSYLRTQCKLGGD